MAGKLISDASQTISAATTGGYITVGSTAGFYAKCHAYLSNTGQTTVEVIITEITSATVMGIRLVRPLGQGPSYGRDDVSAYNGGTINIPAQIAYNPNDQPIT